MPTALVADALKMAVELRGGDVRGVIFHSDRGNICRTSTESCVNASVSDNQPAEWRHASTILSPRRSGRV
jgi:transposase InsO family protein